MYSPFTYIQWRRPFGSLPAASDSRASDKFAGTRDDPPDLARNSIKVKSSQEDYIIM